MSKKSSTFVADLENNKFNPIKKQLWTRKY